MFLLKLITIAPAQTVTGIIMAVSNRKPVVIVRSSEMSAVVFPVICKPKIKQKNRNRSINAKQVPIIRANHIIYLLAEYGIKKV